MKLSSLIRRAEDALELYGDLEINAYFESALDWLILYDHDDLIYYDKEKNELLLDVGLAYGREWNGN